jgi:quercetin dioxygenase-like cupin family protein
MRFFSFDPVAGRPIDRFDSAHAVLSPIQRMSGQVQIGCMHVGPGGTIGYHQADPMQLFLVVQGDGWVRSSDQPEPVAIRAGQAAFWESGEWHASGSLTGMTVIVIEGETLDPGQYMPEESLG